MFVFRQGLDEYLEGAAKEGGGRGRGAALRAGVGHLAALLVPPRIVHRLVPLRSQVLQEQGQQW